MIQLLILPIGKMIESCKFEISGDLKMVVGEG